MLEVLTGLNPSAADAKAPGGIAFPVEERLAPQQPGAIDRCCRALDACASWPAQLGAEFGTLALRAVHAHDERSRPVFVEVVRSLRSMAARNPPGAAAAPLQTAQRGPAAQALAAGPAPPASPQQPQRCLVRSPAQSPGGGAPSPAGAQEAPVAPATPVRPAVANGPTEALDPDFFLELVAAHGQAAEAVSPLLRQLPLAAAAGCLPGPDGKVTQQIGRHHQAEFFEAWLPDVSSRSCVSRKAIEVSWAPGADEAWLTACGTNPVSVDGKVVQKGAGAALRPGSDIIFSYELKVLLRLRFVACGPVVTEAPAVAAAQRGCQEVDAEGRWSACRSLQLSGEDLQEMLSSRMVVLEGSVNDAINRLNAGLVPDPGAYCAVYSATKSAYYLLYQAGMKDRAFACLGVAGGE
ncbi:unnamed protein product, partial [Prorocentrum cordatum]